MPLRYDTVTFMSDYGHTDEFVGVVHSVIRSIAPQAAVVDLTHGVAPYDVRAGGLVLARSVQYLCPGVVLAVVDPGVGSERRAVAVEVGDGQSVLVGPDNGLLAPAVAMCGGATRAVVLDDPEFQLATPGTTFAGRDVFAPAAAWLCTGVPLESLGTVVDPAGLLPGILPVAHVDDADPAVLVAEVLWLSFADTSRVAQRAASYAAVSTGAVGLVVDSYGLVSVVVDRSSAAGELGLVAGTEVRLRAVDPSSGVPGGVSVSIGDPGRRP
jgi:S-adenosylmethionine hydrolase